MTSPTASSASDRGTITRVLVGCGLVSFLSLPTLHIYLFGVFAIAIAQSNGWTAEQVAATIGPALLSTLFMHPLNGWIIQRFHKPTLAVLAHVGAAAGLGLLAISPPDLRLFKWALFAAVLLCTLTTPAIASALVAENIDRRRGLALGVVMACSGIGVAVLPVVAAKLIGLWGWRAAYGALAAATLVAAIANIFLLHNASARSAALNVASADRRGEFLAATRTSTFWIIAGFFFLLAVAVNAVPLYLPLILKARGGSPELTSLSLTIMGLTMIVSRPVTGYLIDRLPIRAVLAIIVVGPLAGSASLLLLHGTVAALLCTVGFGLAIGGEFVCLGYMVSRGFSLTSFGTIYGWLAFAFAAGQALGPMAIGAMIAAEKDYDPVLMLMIFASLASLGLGMCLSDSKFRPSGAALATTAAPGRST